MTPTEADKNPSAVTLKQRKIENKKGKFKIGDKVRISLQRAVFTNRYLPNWSTEIFTVVKINKTSTLTYQLEDCTGNPIAGCFYQEEIYKTNFPDDFLIEKIVREKGSLVLVKWLGFDSSHNSWTNTVDLKK